MTKKIFGRQSTDAPKFSGYNLLAKTTTLSSDFNGFSGMLNPQLSAGTTSFTFSDIPQQYKDLKIVLRNMGHSHGDTNGYRLIVRINGDATNTRYYSRAGYQVTGSGGNTSVNPANWNSDNTDGIYWGYLYNPGSTSWAGNGEITIPAYSISMPTNFRGGYGSYWNMNYSSYNLPYGFQYYNNAAAALPVTSLSFSIESSRAFQTYCDISLYGLG